MLRIARLQSVMTLLTGAGFFQIDRRAVLRFVDLKIEGTAFVGFEGFHGVELAGGERLFLRRGGGLVRLSRLAFGAGSRLRRHRLQLIIPGLAVDLKDKHDRPDLERVARGEFGLLYAFAVAEGAV